MSTFIEERIRDNHTERAMHRLPECNYVINPVDFAELVQRLGAKEETDKAGAVFVKLFFFGDNPTVVYTDPDAPRGLFQPREAAPAGLENPIGIVPRAPAVGVAREQSTLELTSGQLHWRLRQKLLHAAHRALDNGQPDLASQMIGAYEQLMRAGM